MPCHCFTFHMEVKGNMVCVCGRYPRMSLELKNGLNKLPFRLTVISQSLLDNFNLYNCVYCLLFTVDVVHQNDRQVYGKEK